MVLKILLCCVGPFIGGGYGIAYVLIGGSFKCRHIADRGGEGVKKGPKNAYILKERPPSKCRGANFLPRRIAQFAFAQLAL